MISLGPKLRDYAFESLLALGREVQITDARVTGRELAPDKTEILDSADKLRHGALQARRKQGGLDRVALQLRVSVAALQPRL